MCLQLALKLPIRFNYSHRILCLLHLYLINQYTSAWKNNNGGMQHGNIVCNLDSFSK